MRPHTPDRQTVHDWVKRTGAGVPDDRIDEFVSVVTPLSEAFRRLDELADDLGVDQPTTRSVVAREPENDPLRMWRWKFTVPAARAGQLDGYRVAVKDTIAVAGVPLAAGSDLLADYVPDQDATVVERVLGAGAEIVGTTVCENLALSGNSHTSAHGPTLNPYDADRSSGGSSNGSAVAVATGEADLALGGDQGGSARMPASWVGILGLKPTHGLVPYTGCFPFDKTVDHVGLFSRDIVDMAKFLDVVAGPDNLDPLAITDPVAGGYAAALAADTGNIRVALLSEGFAQDGADPEVDQMVRKSALELRDSGSEVTEVSIPAHLDSLAIAAGVSVQGYHDTMINRVQNRSWFHEHLPGLTEQLSHSMNERFESLPPNVLRYLLLGDFYSSTQQEHFYRRARALNRHLCAQYDAAFERVDVLCMPTTITTAQPIPRPDSHLVEYVTAAAEAIANTAAFNVTGHPAISVPCGLVNGLPVGLMFVGRRGRDDVVLQAAQRLLTARQTEVARIQPPQSQFSTSKAQQ